MRNICLFLFKCFGPLGPLLHGLTKCPKSFFFLTAKQALDFITYRISKGLHKSLLKDTTARGLHHWDQIEIQTQIKSLPKETIYHRTRMELNLRQHK